MGVLDMIANLFRDTRKVQLEELLAESAKWWPAAINGKSFYDENETRWQYLLGNMRGDMEDQLKAAFPQGWKDKLIDQINLPLLRSEIYAKAMVFLGKQEFYLIDADGNRVESPEFSEMIERSQLTANLKTMDRYTQTFDRSGVKPNWNQRLGRVALSCWPQHLVRIVPDPERYWDSDAALAHLFELPPTDGNAGGKPRWEVWAKRSEDVAEELGLKTLHFKTDGEDDFKINNDDVIPYIDPTTGEPIYPLVWFSSDTSSDIYSLSDSDKLSTNRSVNLMLCHLLNAMRYKAYGVWCHAKAENGSDLGVKFLSPSTVVDLAPGARLENVSTNLPIGETLDAISQIIKQDGLLRNLPAQLVSANESGSDTGIALRLRMRPLLEHRENMVEIYKPKVEELLSKMMTVHNTYSPDPIPTGLRAVWNPGEIKIEDDQSVTASTYAAEILAGVSTAADWRSERYGETREVAELAVAENIKTNAKNSRINPLDDSTTQPAAQPGPGRRAGMFGDDQE